MNAKEKASFITTVYGYYTTSGRHDLPWRKTTDPYKIAVSEIMLQQTQVPRVLEKYKEFLKAFPDVQTLAAAPLQQVLFHWSGLGYNRRARFLHQMAQTITQELKGKFPRTYDELLKLPGVGKYTAGAIAAFAYNIPMPIIETNIRTVYLHHFFKDNTEAVHDKDILPLIEQTLDQDNAREWYWALMDYGSYLKQSGVTIHRKSVQYKKQSTFKGSVREVRGGIMKILSTQSATRAHIQKITGFSVERIDIAIQTLIQEGMVIKKGKQILIA